MILLPHYSGKTIAILGLGKTGIAAAQALKVSGAHVVLWDDKPASCEQLPAEFASSVSPPSDWDWSQLDALLLSPGIALTHPKPHEAVTLAHQHGVAITSDIELLLEACAGATFIAITGTNGKSTTTALIGHILQEAGRRVQVGGNIGNAALEMQPMGAGDICVLELSSYQLDLLQRQHINIALWLNISPDHIDRHGDIDGYIAAKKKIFAHQGAGDVAIVGVDDAYSEAVARELIADKAQRVVPISVREKTAHGIWVQDAQMHDETSGQRLDLSVMPNLRGAHNHQNAVAAYAACRAVGVAHAQIASAMASFDGLAHRMQKIAECGGVSFVNDSKATNADAAEKSLASYETIYWIAGGVAKEGGIAPLANYFPRVQKAYLIGQAQEDFAQTLEGRAAYALCDSLAEATRQAYADARAAGGGVVLLAPACASFDQFSNFEQRGEAFAKAAQELCA